MDWTVLKGMLHPPITHEYTYTHTPYTDSNTDNILKHQQEQQQTASAHAIHTCHFIARLAILLLDFFATISFQ